MNLKPLPSPNGTNKAGLYIPASWPWKGPPDGAYDAMPRDVRRQPLSRQSSYQREIAKGEAYGKAFVERMYNTKAASRSGMAFDTEREDDMRDDLDPVAVARCLGHLAGKLSPEDLQQVRALLKGDNNQADKPITGPMTHQGSSAWGNLADRAARDDGDVPKALEGTFAGQYAKAQARDAQQRKAARAASDMGIGEGVGGLLGGLLGSTAGPVGAIVGSQIGGSLGGSAEKGLTHMITDPA